MTTTYTSEQLSSPDFISKKAQFFQGILSALGITNDVSATAAKINQQLNTEDRKQLFNWDSLYIGFVQNTSNMDALLRNLFKLFKVLCLLHLDENLKRGCLHVDTNTLLSHFSKLIEVRFLDESGNIKPIFAKSDIVNTFVWLYKTLDNYPAKDKGTQWALAFRVFMFGDSDHLEEKRLFIDSQINELGVSDSNTDTAGHEIALNKHYHSFVAADIRLAVKMLFGKETIEQDFKGTHGFKAQCAEFRKKEGNDVIVVKPNASVEFFSAPAQKEPSSHHQARASDKSKRALQEKIESRLSWLKFVFKFTFDADDVSLLQEKMSLLNAMLSNIVSNKHEAIQTYCIDKQRSSFFHSDKTRTRELFDEYESLIGHPVSGNQ
ncbi:hypothetical protein Lrub_1465 [Legionella rubrilucens]|uniref:Uncharacterized protein n=1 Tax=Legionella rubrilucens TaxID=458 RepID=A0A0W0XX22_9GAMM|nr:hypothetical protein [Legionella rubrilucens]KTD49114.1 hypothetical protein Lrub_1465 [Legionella rubrilucens]